MLVQHLLYVILLAYLCFAHRKEIKIHEMTAYGRGVPALVTSQLLMTPQKRQKEDPKPVFLTFLQHPGTVWERKEDDGDVTPSFLVGLQHNFKKTNK